MATIPVKSREFGEFLQQKGYQVFPGKEGAFWRVEMKRSGFREEMRLFFRKEIKWECDCGCGERRYKLIPR